VHDSAFLRRRRKPAGANEYPYSAAARNRAARPSAKAAAEPTVDGRADRPIITGRIEVRGV
jgi:hypothetical protein